MPLPDNDPYDDLYGDAPSQTGEAKSGSAADNTDGADGKAGPGADGKEEPKQATQAAPAKQESTKKAEKPAQLKVENVDAKPILKEAEGEIKRQSPAADFDPYDDLYADIPDTRVSASALAEAEDTEGENQDNFVESKEPSELLMCLILASAYLGLAKYCWTPLILAKDWKLLFNIEGFFLCIAVLAILIGLRPYISPSSLQVSRHGIKYRGPYWPQRKTINWNQVGKLYLSPELIVVLYHPKLTSRRLWPMLIPIVYLSDRERIAKVFIKYSPIHPVILTSPALMSRIVVLLAILGVIIWVLEMLIH